jgi:hypothetical protein
VVGAGDRPGGEEGFELGGGVGGVGKGGGEAGVWPALGAGDELGAEGIDLDVAEDMGVGELADEARETCVGGWPEDQVPVVGHEAPGEDADGGDLEGIGNGFEEGGRVAVGVEDAGGAVVAVDDVVGQAGGSEASGGQEAGVNTLDCDRLRLMVDVPVLPSPFFPRGIRKLGSCLDDWMPVFVHILDNALAFRGWNRWSENVGMFCDLKDFM